MSILEDYKQQIPKLQSELGMRNVHQVPRLSKIMINMGVKDALLDKKNLEKAQEVLGKIAGQRPKIVKAKKSIATFKLRQGDEMALLVTLRGKRMYDFFEKLTKIVLPRLRDFHGVSQGSFDGHGNYTLGFTENTVFPEVDPAALDKIRGLEVTIVTTAKNNDQGLVLLKALGMPFKG